MRGRPPVWRRIRHCEVPGGRRIGLPWLSRASGAELGVGFSFVMYTTVKRPPANPSQSAQHRDPLAQGHTRAALSSASPPACGLRLLDVRKNVRSAPRRSRGLYLLIPVRTAL